MIVELIMDWFKWEAIWGPHSGYRPKKKRGIGRGPWFVGTWTGPDNDLLCIRECKTMEAYRWLSPPGRTILHAVILSVWEYWITRKQPTIKE